MGSPILWRILSGLPSLYRNNMALLWQRSKIDLVGTTRYTHCGALLAFEIVIKGKLFFQNDRNCGRANRAFAFDNRVVKVRADRIPCCKCIDVVSRRTYQFISVRKAKGHKDSFRLKCLCLHSTRLDLNGNINSICIFPYLYHKVASHKNASRSYNLDVYPGRRLDG